MRLTSEENFGALQIDPMPAAAYHDRASLVAAIAAAAHLQAEAGLRSRSRGLPGAATCPTARRKQQCSAMEEFNQ
jgi:hypothetical protein